MGQTDRNAGLVANAAIKNPCVAATTGDITLSGGQTVDGIAVVTGDRVLVKAQSADTENGIYEVDSGDWTRTKDSNGAYDLVTGSLVYVRTGTAAAGWWYCTTTDPVTIGTDSITWAAASTALATVSPFMQTMLDDTTAVAARQTLVFDKSGSNVPAAATIDLDAATGDFINVTGTTGITAITLADGVEKTVRFTGSLLLTHSAALVCPSNVSIQTAAGDMAVVRGDSGSTVRVIGYQRLQEHGSDVASAATLVLDTTTGTIIDVTGTVTVTAVTLAEGQQRTVRFTGALTLTDGASLVLPGAANITTAAGDFCVMTGYAAGVVRVSSYSKLSGLANVVDDTAHAKVWGFVSYSGGTPTLETPDLNVDSITDTAEGQLTVNIATDFATDKYVILTTGLDTNATPIQAVCAIKEQAVGSFNVATYNSGAGSDDPDGIFFACFGAQ